MAKSKVKSIKENPDVVETVEAEQPSNGLLKKVNSLKQIVNLHDLVNQGQYNGFMNVRITEALEWLVEQHKEALAEVNADPQGHLAESLITAESTKGEQ